MLNKRIEKITDYEYVPHTIKIGKEIARVSLHKIGKKATEKALNTAARKLSRLSEKIKNIK